MASEWPRVDNIDSGPFSFSPLPRRRTERSRAPAAQSTRTSFPLNPPLRQPAARCAVCHESKRKRGDDDRPLDA
ncbi:hypothetical protein C7M70_06585 [Serratia marcescens]|nr:hypothetical protein C7M66_19530 [Serratia marcescens]AXX25937.1 hypothetical protein C7M65_18475 [Serratia marcescens]RTE99601.1 hypothetical protein C7M68_11610 [Serratia marcescens]RTF02480.1 hypothetical protein C7M70_06585 [Serratia marcescens]RTF07448.1 hypothetical protein C7M69_02855 [Serratia marcescens]